MSEPARVDPDVDVEAAREALVPRMRKGDWAAFEEFFALSGGSVTFVDSED